MSNNSICQSRLDLIANDIAQGKALTKVDLSNCNLTEFPLNLLLPCKNTLEMINFGGNNLSSLPEEIAEFRKLRILFFAQNKFNHVPEVLGLLPSLYMLSFKSNIVERVSAASLSPSIHWLILTDNKISELPPTIGNLSKLRKLMLSGNQLTSLPDELQRCQELELVRIAVNRLTHLPRWLISLPRLSWIAISGNPFERGGNTYSSCPVAKPPIEWASLKVGDRLGEGASGEIFRANFSIGTADPLDLAVKVFKGSITSDGLAEDEINITERIGEHPSFMKVIGRVVGHPDGKLALLFPLLNQAEYFTLGLPPSFDSITRDVYTEGTSFSLAFALNVLQSIAAACLHLHSYGIMHGDIYSHNILSKSTGVSLLTDFGAASLPGESFGKDVVGCLEKIEVRAFGCLIEDLLLHLETISREDKNVDVVQQLQFLSTQCLHVDFDQRPTFHSLVESLSQIVLSL